MTTDELIAREGLIEAKATFENVRDILRGD